MQHQDSLVTNYLGDVTTNYLKSKDFMTVYRYIFK